MAVNTTVLDSTVSSIEGPSPLAEALVPVAALSVDSTIPVDSTVPVAQLSAVVPASVQSAYDVQGSGVITLEQSGQSLNVVSVNPVSGWTYKSENNGSNRVEVEFVNGTQRVKFTAELLNDRIVTAVEAIDTSVASPSTHDDENEDEFEDEGGDEGESEDEHEDEDEGDDD